MRNVTVSLDEGTARWARVEAAKRDQSLSRYIADLLWAERDRESRMTEAAASYRSRPARSLKTPGESYPERDELHGR